MKGKRRKNIHRKERIKRVGEKKFHDNEEEKKIRRARKGEKK